MIRFDDRRGRGARWGGPGALLLVTSLVGGCHTFEPIEADGRCGNGVLEPSADEDCDGHGRVEGSACGAPSTPQACRYVCDDEAGAVCPPGWRCGLDHVCRAGSGRFDGPEVTRIAGIRLLAGDMDGDRRDDLVVLSNTEMTVAYGDREGGFTSRSAVPIAAPDEKARLADLDGDGAGDVLLPSAHGVQLFLGHAARRLVPIAVPFDAVPTPSDRPTLALPVITAPAIEQHDILLAAQPGATVELAVQGRPTDAEELTAMLGRGGPLLARLAVGDVHADGPSADEVAIARLGDTVVHVASVECEPGSGAPCRLIPRATVPVADDLPLAGGGTWFADVNGDRRMDLIATVDLGEEFAIAVGEGTGDGDFAELRLHPEMADAANCRRCSRSLLQEPGLRDVVDVNGDGLADYLNRTGIFLADPGPPYSLVRVIHPGRPWSQMTVADLNRDGVLDVAATRPGTVDIILAAAPGRYNVLSAPTEADPEALVAGDFDGDLVPDLALVERPATLSVLFSGRQGAATERVVMAELPAVSHLAKVRSGEDFIDDLLVTMPRGDEPDLLVRLSGDSSRRMASTIPRRAPVILSVVAGRFTGGPGLDVIVSEPAPPPGAGPSPGGGGPSGGSGPPILFRLASMQGAFGASRVVERALPRVEGCDFSRGGFLLSAAADLDDDGLDEFLVQQTWGPEFGPGLPRRGYTFRSMRVVDGELHCEPMGDIETIAPPGSLHVVDLDGDGRRDVVLALDPAASERRGRTSDEAEAGLAVFWGDAATPARLTARPEIYPVTAARRSSMKVAPVEVDGDAGSELAYAGEVGVGILAFDAERRLTETTPQPLIGDPLEVVGVDADGDGLDDIAVATGNEILI